MRKRLTCIAGYHLHAEHCNAAGDDGVPRHPSSNRRRADAANPESPRRRAPAFGIVRSFLITAVVLFSRRDFSSTTGCTSTPLVLMGDSIATVVLINFEARSA